MGKVLERRREKGIGKKVGNRIGEKDLKGIRDKVGNRDWGE
jgi:hypothetical protein